MSSPRAPDEQEEEKRDGETEEKTSSSVNEKKSEDEKPVGKRPLSPDLEPAISAKIAKKTDESEASSNSGSPSDLSTGTSREVVEPEPVTDHTLQVAQHYNSLEETGFNKRNQSRIVYMRNFNNWIKSMLISEYVAKVRQDNSHGAPIRVLDMCCGKGGDLFKWRKGNISHLICADIAGVSVEQCQARYNDMISRSKNERGFAPVFTAEFLTQDCTKVRLREKYRDPSLKLDLVSCQFAFHYSFESLQQAECMLRNAAESLRTGGYFIATLPDAYDLVSRWYKCDGNKYGNDLYTVDFQCDKTKPPPLFGAKYNFCLEGVVDCPEFLVHQPTLRKLALKFGLECVLFERFEDFYERMKTEGRSLLGKIQALETYPPYLEAPLLGQNPGDYQHAVQYMQSSTGHRKIGTLSKPEWEATSLYAVMAFQKMKTTWNAEGKPEYTKQ
ncbi:mRNA cap guanine-N7 methyltransferase [Venturia canescens]|uniref:mRNA cap guanine-N7 methyltransferase n=1 Tax=Venturia canescens TaxID=32260 RepID=UPI001C9C5243|nr:mRNA cap guanine-N7 methyltransferase [Venturia canescens]